MQCSFNYIYYKAVKNDSLSKIAGKHNVSVGDIFNLNKNIDLKNIYDGLRIKIPSNSFCCPYGNFYKIRKNDTLYSLSKYHNISPDMLLLANPALNPNLINIGQVIIIPYNFNDNYNNPKSTNIIYTLKDGEDLISVCKKFDIKPTSLLEANRGIRALEFIPGKSVYIPN